MRLGLHLHCNAHDRVLQENPAVEVLCDHGNLHMNLNCSCHPASPHDPQENTSHCHCSLPPPYPDRAHLYHVCADLVLSPFLFADYSYNHEALDHNHQLTHTLRPHKDHGNEKNLSAGSPLCYRHSHTLPCATDGGLTCHVSCCHDLPFLYPSGYHNTHPLGHATLGRKVHISGCYHQRNQCAVMHQRIVADCHG